MNKFCQKCGQELPEGAAACSNCGMVVNQGQTVVQNVPYKNPTNGMAIAGFVLSLVSLICCGSTSLLGLIFSIVGLVQSKKLNGSGKGMAIAGIVISCILVIIVIVLFALGLMTDLLKSASAVDSY